MGGKRRNVDTIVGRTKYTGISPHDVRIPSDSPATRANKFKSAASLPIYTRSERGQSVTKGQDISHMQAG